MITYRAGKIRARWGAGATIVAGFLWLLAGCSVPTEEGLALPYGEMAGRIVEALQVEEGERVILRTDSGLMPNLATEARQQLEAAGATVDEVPYGPVEDFEERMAETDIYIWLPVRDQATAYLPEQMAVQVKWLDEGRGRQIHFHWGDGTRYADSTNATHNEAYDRVYLDALDIDYSELDRQMEAAIARLRSGEVRVTTPAGTDIRFRLGDRFVTKQNGNASKAEASLAEVRIAYETELPAGAMRMAPLEDSVNGTIVIPQVQFGNAAVTNIQLTFVDGVIIEATAEESNSALQEFLSSNDALQHFREFALGFNPKLVTPDGETAVAYYGYGAGMVRLSLGDNSELGGQVSGGGVAWFFFPDATVQVGDTVLVEDGKLRVD
jgi:hypothetical protein